MSTFFTPAKLGSYAAILAGPLIAVGYGAPMLLSFALTAVGALSAFLWCWDDLTAIARQKILDIG